MTAMHEPGAVQRSAIISDDGVYRYSLARWWDTSLPRDLWIMLNPSTADAAKDDRTIRRCIGFSRSWGSGGLVVVNLYGYRATDPDDLFAAQKAGVDVIGPENDGWIRAHLATERGYVIAAWGATGARAWKVRQYAKLAGQTLTCLGTTKNRQPRHPLYVRADTPLVRMAGS